MKSFHQWDSGLIFFVCINRMYFGSRYWCYENGLNVSWTSFFFFLMFFHFALEVIVGKLTLKSHSSWRGRSASGSVNGFWVLNMQNVSVVFFFFYKDLLKSATEMMEVYLTISDTLFFFFLFLPQRLFYEVKFKVSQVCFWFFCVYLNGYFHHCLHGVYFLQKWRVERQIDG